MGIVPRYTKTVLPAGADTSAAQTAGAVAGALGDVAQGALQFKRAKDASFINERGAMFEREVDDFYRQSKIDYQNDPDAGMPELKSFVDKRYGELSKSASPEAKAAFGKVRDDIKRGYSRKNEDFARKQNVSNFATSFDNSIKEISTLAFRAGQNGEDLQDHINSAQSALLAGSTFMGEADLENLTKESQARITAEYLQGAVERDPLGTQKLVNSGKFDDVLTSRQIQALDAAGDRERARRNAEFKKAQAAQRQKKLDDINLKIFNTRDINQEQSLTLEDLTQDLESGNLTVKQYIAAGKSLEAAEKVRQEKTEHIDRMARFNDGTFPLNPNDKDDMKSLDTFYNDIVLPEIEQLPPEQQVQAQVNFVEQKGIIPTALKQKLQNDLYTGAPDDRVQASNVTNDIIRRNPAMARQFSAGDIAFSAKVATGVNSGLSASEAIEFSEAQTFLKNTPEFQARNTQFNKEGGKFKRSEVDPFFFGNPDEVPPEMEAEWKSLYRYFSVNEGVEDGTAQKAAYARLKSTWGVSKVSGKNEYMKYAPEAYYEVSGVDNSWMKEQLNEMGEGLSIIPDLRTVRSGKPAYQLIKQTTTEDGNIIIDSHRNESGEPVYWIPEYTETKEYKKNAKEFAEEQKEQRELFEKRRKKNLETREQLQKNFPDAKITVGVGGAPLVDFRGEK